jgi:hypothetical protein
LELVAAPCLRLVATVKLFEWVGGDSVHASPICPQASFARLKLDDAGQRLSEHPQNCSLLVTDSEFKFDVSTKSYSCFSKISFQVHGVPNYPHLSLIISVLISTGTCTIPNI